MVKVCVVFLFIGDNGVGLLGGVGCCILMILRFCNQFKLVRLSSRLESLESLLLSLRISGGFRASQFCLKRRAASLVVRTGVRRIHDVAMGLVEVALAGAAGLGVVGVEGWEVVPTEGVVVT